ncbi:hypothetical protein ACHAW6_014506 [Cyclotella cf. meneghiniana]
MVLYHVATNFIWVQAMRNKKEGKLILTRACALQRMVACGIKPTKQVLDNKASASYKHAIINSNMSYQLITIALLKKPSRCGKTTSLLHSVAMQPNSYYTFGVRPFHKWSQLNLLHQSHTNPKTSAYAQLYGHHGYNALPFIPIDMDALVHDKPSCCSSFAQHCTKVWVLGTSPKHYR